MHRCIVVRLMTLEIRIINNDRRLLTFSSLPSAKFIILLFFRVRVIEGDVILFAVDMRSCVFSGG